MVFALVPQKDKELACSGMKMDMWNKFCIKNLSVELSKVFNGIVYFYPGTTSFSHCGIETTTTKIHRLLSLGIMFCLVSTDIED